MNAQSFGGEKGMEAAVVGLAVAGDEAVLVFVPVFHFMEGILHAERDDFGGVGGTGRESSAEFLVVRRHDEEVDEGALDGGVVASADLGGTLDIDVHDHVLAAFEEGMDLGAEGAVVMAVDFGVFEELAGGDVSFELVAGEEVVVAAIEFAFAGGAGGAGD